MALYRRVVLRFGRWMQDEEHCRTMIAGLLQLATTDAAVPAADRLKLYMALLGLGLVALFAMVLLTVIRRVTKPRIAPRRDSSRQVSPWEAAGRRARPEGGDGFLPVIGANDGPGGNDRHPHNGHHHHDDGHSGDADGGGGSGGDGGGGGGDGGGGGGGD